MKSGKVATGALRQHAVENLKNMSAFISSPQPSHETQRLLEELYVHQIELEMQNEELRHAKAELERSQKRLADHYDFAPVGYCVVREDGVILEANLTAADLLRLVRGKLIQQPISRFIFKEDQDVFHLLIKQLLAKSEPQSCELRLVRQGMDSFWVRLQAAIRREENGRTLIRLVLSDINSRKRTEEALVEIHRQNQEILESITDAFISLDDNMIVRYFNAAAERMFKQKRTAAIGRWLFDIFPAGRGSIFEKHYTYAIRTKSAISFQAEIPEASQPNWYDVRVYPARVGITVYIQVITEQIQAREKEAKLDSVQRHLQKAKSLSRMAGAIAHHFNNKLFVVMSYLDLVLDDLTIGVASKKRLVIARQEADKAAEVSKLMLSYLGQVTGKQEHLELSDVCRKIRPLLKGTLPKNVALVTHLQSPGPVILANVEQIRLILTNLVTNAWEAYADACGSIRLTAKNVSPSEIPILNRFPVDWQPEDISHACLEIQDNGCGISEQDIEEIFSPFYSTKFTGRGLGLSVALGLVKANGGAITLESMPGKGSIFRVYFPVSEERRVHLPEERANVQKKQTTGKVLLIDDDEIVLKISSVMLSALGFEVLTAMDGIDAVAVFQKHKSEIRLVLSDVSMPRMNGWDTLNALRKIMPGIPVILISGYSEELVMQGVHPERPQAFLEKPYNIETLRAVVYRTLQEVKQRELQ